MSRQGGRTRHDNRDANETPIVDALRDAGYTVTRCKEPMLDLFVTGHGRAAILEVKNLDVNPPADALGVKGTRKGGDWHDIELLYPGRARYLRESQALFIRRHHGQGIPIVIVTTPAEALRAMGGVSEKKPLSEWISKFETEDHGPVRSTCRVCEAPLLMLGRYCSSKCFDVMNPIVDES